jgi:hypothetical protein
MSAVLPVLRTCSLTPHSTRKSAATQSLYPFSAQYINGVLSDILSRFVKSILSRIAHNASTICQKSKFFKSFKIIPNVHFQYMLA